MRAFEPGAPHAGAHPLDDQLRSSSAIAATITMMARPSGPPGSLRFYPSPGEPESQLPLKTPIRDRTYLDLALAENGIEDNTARLR